MRRQDEWKDEQRKQTRMKKVVEKMIRQTCPIIGSSVSKKSACILMLDCNLLGTTGVAVVKRKQEHHPKNFKTVVQLMVKRRGLKVPFGRKKVEIDVFQEFGDTEETLFTSCDDEEACFLRMFANS